jgi:endonuclease/exonuclease/phosphatase (EEP) superfamily protein YafD
MIILKFILSYVIIIAVILPFIPEEEWWVRIFEFPRFQLALIGIGVIVLSLFYFDKNNLHDILVLILVIAATVYQLVLVYPYTFVSPKQVLPASGNSGERNFSIFISNVLQDNRNVNGYLDIIKGSDPDIILALETDYWWRDNLSILKENYPFYCEYPLDNTYGIILFSRLKLVEPEIKFLVEKDIPSIHTWVELKSGETVYLHCLHPEPPTPENKDSDERDAELLIVAKEVKKNDFPSIVAGDLNDVAWSYTTKLFQEISGLLDPRVGRGFYNTFSTGTPIFRWPLDYIFHSVHFKLIKLERLPDFGSDHFPVIAHLSYEPEESSDNKEKHADREDKIEAEEKIEEGLNDKK